MQSLISSQTVQAELRWERTKNWRHYADVKESASVEVNVEGAGKIRVHCKYISLGEIKQHIMQD